jgi:hypothetical protein
MPLPMPNSGFNTGGAGFGQAWHICQMQHPWFPSLLLPGTDSNDLTTKLGEFADQDQNAQQSHIDPYADNSVIRVGYWCRLACRLR